ncbi:succinyl-CoA ligase subunit alpha [Aureobasidium pullulans]|uniref:Succinyl-CoA ligase subunit alpha n=1 Tax=Aureobasidium pullulans TaxID=5580 RepID=A0A4S8SCJ5_AURPU|nr:succinyl-CoA ligase subunit alpha [Aureobasidium pullulans]
MPVPRGIPGLSRLRTRAFSTSVARTSYEDTVQNLKIGKHTRVLYQGFTGRVATQNAKESLEWGTNIVGGVKPGSTGEHLGLPVLPTVREAKEQLRPDATAIYVAAPHAGKAIEEAIEAEIPLIVAVAEHIPLHDILRIMSILKTQSKSRLVGANAPGIISAIGKCRIGFQPLPTFSPGHIGIVAKSGTLSYETVASITRSGLGQSLCIGMGGDVVAGTNFVDALRVFETDPDTEAIVLVGEVGGSAEQEAADWIKDYHQREKNPKPIAALVGGRMAPPGRVMGHAGAWAGVGEATAGEKYKILQNAGVTMVDHPEMFGNVMKSLLKQAGKDVSKIQQSAAANQRRGMHTMRQVRPRVVSRAQKINLSQQRDLHLREQKAVDHLSKSLEGFTISEETPQDTDSVYLSISVDRSNRQPCIITSPSSNPRKIHHRLRRFPYSYLEGPDKATIMEAIKHLQLDAAPPAAHAQTAKLISSLASLHRSQEAVSLAVNLSISSSGTLHLSSPQLFYDDAAFKSNNRHPELHALRDPSQENAVEVEAEKSGIVFVKLNTDDPHASIGTLVNGAGLAMNTIDALALPPHNGACSNFLDTGGKATSQTVKKSFELILSDPRVKVIFVNIFGGLTDCGMIADGVILAFKEVDMRGIPVVVRLRGTNEEEGQRKIAESGLELEAFDGFEEAATRVVELSGQ